MNFSQSNNLLKIVLVTIIIGKCDCLSNWLCDFLHNTTVNQISAKCLEQLNIVCQNPHLSWMMFDASSKYPYPGISYSNHMDLGNYPECLSIKYEDKNGRILGKHCGLGVLLIDFLLPNDLEKVTKNLNMTELNYNNRIMKSHDTYLVLEKELRGFDPNNYVISTLSWCIPNSCTAQEVGNYFLVGKTGLIYYSTTPCETVETNTSLETIDILVITLLSIILILIIMSTCYDLWLYQLKEEPKSKILIAFSLYTNSQKLFKLTKTTSKEQIKCFDGVRTISMIWILAGHSIAMYPYMPLINLRDAESYENHWRSQFIRSAKLAVDTFFFMSGFLVAYNYLKKATKISAAKQVLGVPSLYLYRYLRLTPALLMVLLVQISIFRFLGSGPVWSIMTNQTDNCKRQWWEVLLYVQNYIHYDEMNMCLLQTWYLCADMQMFILAPLVLIPLSMFVKKNFKMVLYSLIGLSTIAVVVPLVIRLADHSITNNYDTHSRLSNYLIGMLIAAFMRETSDKSFAFSKKQNIIIWTIVLMVAFVVQIIYFIDSVNYEYETHYVFDNLYRPIWCLCLSWIIYSCHHGYGGIINGILTLPIFQIGAKISYCMYLVHNLVIIHHIGSMKVPNYFSDYEMVFNWCGYLVMTTILCIIWTLAFESPMITIEKVIFENLDGKTVKKNDLKL